MSSISDIYIIPLRETDITYSMPGPYNLGINVAGSVIKYELTKINYLAKFLYESYTFVAFVTIPDGANFIKIGVGDWRTDKILVTQMINIRDLECWNDPNFRATALQTNGISLKYIKNEFKTRELCSIAVSKTGDALQFVPNEFKTVEMCETAIRDTGYSLKFVSPNLLTYELCLLAIRDDGDLVEYVPARFQTRELCLTAVKNNGRALRFVINQTDEIRVAAIQDDKEAVQFIR